MISSEKRKETKTGRRKCHNCLQTSDLTASIHSVSDNQFIYQTETLGDLLINLRHPSIHLSIQPTIHPSI